MNLALFARGTALPVTGHKAYIQGLRATSNDLKGRQLIPFATGRETAF